MREHALGAGATQPPPMFRSDTQSEKCRLLFVGGAGFPLSGERALNHMIRMCRHESMSHSLHSMRMSSTAFCNHTEMHRTRRFLFWTSDTHYYCARVSLLLLLLLLSV